MLFRWEDVPEVSKKSSAGFSILQVAESRTERVPDQLDSLSLPEPAQADPWAKTSSTLRLVGDKSMMMMNWEVWEALKENGPSMFVNLHIRLLALADANKMAARKFLLLQKVDTSPSCRKKLQCPVW